MTRPVLTEQQARRVCEALHVIPDDKWHRKAADWPGFPTTPNPLGIEDFALVPAWRIAQRAAEEPVLTAGEIKPEGE